MSGLIDKYVNASANQERTGLEGKTSNAQQKYTMTDKKSPRGKTFLENTLKKNFSKMELFTESPKILSSGCARQSDQNSVYRPQKKNFT